VSNSLSILVLSDVYRNALELEVVLVEVNRRAPDLIVNLGD